MKIFRYFVGTQLHLVCMIFVAMVSATSIANALENIDRCIANPPASASHANIKLDICQKILEEHPDHPVIQLRMYQGLNLQNNHLESYPWLLRSARLGNQEALSILEDPKLYEEAYFFGVRHQNGMLLPKESAEYYYAFALRDPDKTWNRAIVRHINQLTSGLDTRDRRYIAYDRYEAHRVARIRDGDSRRRHLRSNSGMSAGEAFVAVIFGAIALDIANNLSGVYDNDESVREEFEEGQRWIREQEDNTWGHVGAYLFVQ